MKILIFRSLLIATVLGVALTAISSFLMSTYHQSSETLGVSRVLTGYDAIAAMIKAFGIAGYLQGLLGAFILFFVGIFLGAVWQGAWSLRSGKE